jgi:hypothetical protein
LALVSHRQATRNVLRERFKDHEADNVPLKHYSVTNLSLEDKSVKFLFSTSRLCSLPGKSCGGGGAKKKMTMNTANRTFISNPPFHIFQS